jgi:hypothetical protein
MTPQPNRSCASCNAFVLGDEGREGSCIRRAPTSTVCVLPVQNLAGQSGYQPQAFTSWPTVRPDQHCLEWVPRLEILQ